MLCYGWVIIIAHKHDYTIIVNNSLSLIPIAFESLLYTLLNILYDHMQHTIYERRIQSAQSNFYFTESILEVCDVGVINSGEYLCTASLREATANATNATVLTVLNEGIQLYVFDQGL